MTDQGLLEFVARASYARGRRVDRTKEAWSGSHFWEFFVKGSFAGDKKLVPEFRPSLDMLTYKLCRTLHAASPGELCIRQFAEGFYSCLAYYHSAGHTVKCAGVGVYGVRLIVCLFLFIF